MDLKVASNSPCLHTLVRILSFIAPNNIFVLTICTCYFIKHLPGCSKITDQFIFSALVPRIPVLVFPILFILTDLLSIQQCLTIIFIYLMTNNLDPNSLLSTAHKIGSSGTRD